MVSSSAWISAARRSGRELARRTAGAARPAGRPGPSELARRGRSITGGGDGVSGPSASARALNWPLTYYTGGKHRKPPAVCCWAVFAFSDCCVSFIIVFACVLSSRFLVCMPSHLCVCRVGTPPARKYIITTADGPGTRFQRPSSKAHCQLPIFRPAQSEPPWSKQILPPFFDRRVQFIIATTNGPGTRVQRPSSKAHCQMPILRPAPQATSPPVANL